MINAFRELIKYKELLYMLTWRDIRIKYKQSIMGFLWAIFMPTLIVFTGTLVRFGIAKVSGNALTINQILSVSVKAIPWSFFVGSITSGTMSLIGNGNLVTKIYFPKEIFPLSSVFSHLFDLMIASSALILFLAAIRIGLTFQLLWVLPLLCILIILSMSICIFLSAANLFFRDVKYLVSVITSFAIFFTPVFYDVRMFGKYESFLMLNPVAPVLEGLNSSIVLHQGPQLYWILYSALIAILGLFIAMRFFKKLEPKFAESI